MKILNAFAEVGMGIIVIFASVATGCFMAGLISDISDKLRRKV